MLVVNAARRRRERRRVTDNKSIRRTSLKSSNIVVDWMFEIKFFDFNFDYLFFLNILFF